MTKKQTMIFILIAFCLNTILAYFVYTDYKQKTCKMVNSTFQKSFSGYVSNYNFARDSSTTFTIHNSQDRYYIHSSNIEIEQEVENKSNLSKESNSNIILVRNKNGGVIEYKINAPKFCKNFNS